MTPPPQKVAPSQTRRMRDRGFGPGLPPPGMSAEKYRALIGLPPRPAPESRSRLEPRY